MTQTSFLFYCGTCTYTIYIPRKKKTKYISVIIFQKSKDCRVCERAEMVSESGGANKK